MRIQSGYGMYVQFCICSMYANWSIKNDTNLNKKKLLFRKALQNYINLNDIHLIMLKMLKPNNFTVCLFDLNMVQLRCYGLRFSFLQFTQLAEDDKFFLLLRLSIVISKTQ